MKINEEQATRNLIELLAAVGPSGGEGPAAEVTKNLLMEAGAQESWFDYADTTGLPEHFTIGNLIVKIPGTADEPRIMFSAHLDTVPICQGVVPVRKGDRIVPEGKTGLGGDNRASVAAIVSMAQTLIAGDVPYPPMTLVFTVGEENGLHGAKTFTAEQGDFPEYCFNLDGSGERVGVIGALGANRWRAEICGISVHAAANPEGGVSAAVIAANAIASATKLGFFGRIDTDSLQGTANIGSLRGGEADNQVMDALTVTGECRSHCPKSLEIITAAWKNAFETAAANETNSEGKCGSVRFITESDYRSFKLDEAEPVVQRYLRAAPLAGRKAALQVINAGLDANVFNENGIPTITYDAGNHHAHALTEYVHIPRYLEACALSLELAIDRG